MPPSPSTPINQQNHHGTPYGRRPTVTAPVDKSVKDIALEGGVVREEWDVDRKDTDAVFLCSLDRVLFVVGDFHLKSESTIFRAMLNASSSPKDKAVQQNFRILDIQAHHPEVVSLFLDLAIHKNDRTRSISTAGQYTAVKAFADEFQLAGLSQCLVAVKKDVQLQDPFGYMEILVDNAVTNCMLKETARLQTNELQRLATDPKLKGPSSLQIKDALAKAVNYHSPLGEKPERSFSNDFGRAIERAGKLIVNSVNDRYSGLQGKKLAISQIIRCQEMKHTVEALRRHFYIDSDSGYPARWSSYSDSMYSKPALEDDSPAKALHIRIVEKLGLPFCRALTFAMEEAVVGQNYRAGYKRAMEETPPYHRARELNEERRTWEGARSMGESLQPMEECLENEMEISLEPVMEESSAQAGDQMPNQEEDAQMSSASVQGSARPVSEDSQTHPEHPATRDGERSAEEAVNLPHAQGSAQSTSPQSDSPSRAEDKQLGGQANMDVDAQPHEQDPLQAKMLSDAAVQEEEEQPPAQQTQSPVNQTAAQVNELGALEVEPNAKRPEEAAAPQAPQDASSVSQAGSSHSQVDAMLDQAEPVPIETETTKTRPEDPQARAESTQTQMQTTRAPVEALPSSAKVTRTQAEGQLSSAAAGPADQGSHPVPMQVDQQQPVQERPAPAQGRPKTLPLPLSEAARPAIIHPSPAQADSEYKMPGLTSADYQQRRQASNEPDAMMIDRHQGGRTARSSHFDGMLFNGYDENEMQMGRPVEPLIVQRKESRYDKQQKSRNIKQEVGQDDEPEEIPYEKCDQHGYEGLGLWKEIWKALREYLDQEEQALTEPKKNCWNTNEDDDVASSNFDQAYEEQRYEEEDQGDMMQTE